MRRSNGEEEHSFAEGVEEPRCAISLHDRLLTKVSDPDLCQVERGHWHSDRGFGTVGLAKLEGMIHAIAMSGPLAALLLIDREAHLSRQLAERPSKTLADAPLARSRLLAFETRARLAISQSISFRNAKKKGKTITGRTQVFAGEILGFSPGARERFRGCCVNTNQHPSAPPWATAAVLRSRLRLHQ